MRNVIVVGANKEQRRTVVRTALILGAIAAAFYIGFIVLALLK